jgi:hypothetical protein
MKTVSSAKGNAELTYLIGVFVVVILTSIVIAVHLATNELPSIFLVTFIGGLFFWIFTRILFKYDLFIADPFNIYISMPLKAFACSLIIILLPIIIIPLFGILLSAPLVVMYLQIAPLPVFLGNFIIVRFIRWKYQIFIIENKQQLKKLKIPTKDFYGNPL